MSYTGNTIRELDTSRPDGSSEYVAIVDDAIREVKRAVVNEKKVATVSANYTLQATDRAIICTAPVTLTIPKLTTVSSSTSYKEYTIINSSSGTVTLTPTSPDTLPVTSVTTGGVLTIAGAGGTAWIELTSSASSGGGGGGGGWITAVEHKTSAFTLSNADKGKLITAAGTFTISIAPISQLDANWICWINNTGSGVITIDPNGSEVIHYPGGTVGGNTTITLPYSGTAVNSYNSNGILLSVDASKTYFLGVTSTESHGSVVYGESGTFRVPIGVNRVFVSMCGGGGGGSGNRWDGSQWREGFGGGGANSVIKHIVSVTPGQLINITIGASGAGGGSNQNGQAGGTTSFGSYISMAGGGGGTTSQVGYAGGYGGTRGYNHIGGGNMLGNGGMQPGDSGSAVGAGGAGGPDWGSGGSGSPGFCYIEW